MTDIDTRLTALERRVHRLEDEAAISQLVLSYGPAVDSGSADAAADIWTERGTYEYQAGARALTGRAGLAAMVRSAEHQAHLQRGCAHVLTAPHIVIDGDTAVATCYSLMHHHVADTGGYQVSRVSANRWELVRADAGWQVARRTNRLLDGTAAGRDLFAGRALEDREG